MEIYINIYICVNFGCIQFSESFTILQDSSHKKVDSLQENQFGFFLKKTRAMEFVF